MPCPAIMGRATTMESRFLRRIFSENFAPLSKSVSTEWRIEPFGKTLKGGDDMPPVSAAECHVTAGGVGTAA